MSQTQKSPFWYRFLFKLPPTTIPVSIPQGKNTLTEVKVTTDNDLKIEPILIEEFRYRGECSKQILNDVTSTFNLYFIFVGISLSGLGVIYQLSGGIRNNLQTIEAFIFFILGVASSFFFVRFVAIIRNHTRQIACMEVIRAYYIKHLYNQIPDISNVFRISKDNTDYYNYYTGPMNSDSERGLCKIQ